MTSNAGIRSYEPPLIPFAWPRSTRNGPLSYSDVNHAFDSRPIPGYGALDLNASVSNDRYTLRLFAKNAANRLAYLSYYPLINQADGNITQFEATLLQPRMMGISLDARF